MDKILLKCSGVGAPWCNTMTSFECHKHTGYPLSHEGKDMPAVIFRTVSEAFKGHLKRLRAFNYRSKLLCMKIICFNVWVKYLFGILKILKLHTKCLVRTLKDMYIKSKWVRKATFLIVFCEYISNWWCPCIHRYGYASAVTMAYSVDICIHVYISIISLSVSPEFSEEMKYIALVIKAYMLYLLNPLWPYHCSLPCNSQRWHMELKTAYLCD